MNTPPRDIITITNPILRMQLQKHNNTITKLLVPRKLSKKNQENIEITSNALKINDLKANLSGNKASNSKKPSATKENNIHPRQKSITSTQKSSNLGTLLCNQPSLADSHLNTTIQGKLTETQHSNGDLVKIFTPYISNQRKNLKIATQPINKLNSTAEIIEKKKIDKHQHYPSYHHQQQHSSIISMNFKKPGQENKKLLLSDQAKNKALRLLICSTTPKKTNNYKAKSPNIQKNKFQYAKADKSYSPIYYRTEISVESISPIKMSKTPKMFNTLQPSQIFNKPIATEAYPISSVDDTTIKYDNPIHNNKSCKDYDCNGIISQDCHLNKNTIVKMDQCTKKFHEIFSPVKFNSGVIEPFSEEKDNLDRLTFQDKHGISFKDLKIQNLNFSADKEFSQSRAENFQGLDKITPISKHSIDNLNYELPNPDDISKKERKGHEDFPLAKSRKYSTEYANDYSTTGPKFTSDLFPSFGAIDSIDHKNGYSKDDDNMVTIELDLTKHRISMQEGELKPIEKVEKVNKERYTDEELKYEQSKSKRRRSRDMRKNMNQNKVLETFNKIQLLDTTFKAPKPFESFASAIKPRVHLDTKSSKLEFAWNAPLSKSTTPMNNNLGIKETLEATVTTTTATRSIIKPVSTTRISSPFNTQRQSTFRINDCEINNENKSQSNLKSLSPSIIIQKNDTEINISNQFGQFLNTEPLMYSNWDIFTNSETLSSLRYQTSRSINCNIGLNANSNSNSNPHQNQNQNLIVNPNFNLNSNYSRSPSPNANIKVGQKSPNNGKIENDHTLKKEINTLSLSDRKSSLQPLHYDSIPIIETQEKDEFSLNDRALIEIDIVNESINRSKLISSSYGVEGASTTSIQTYKNIKKKFKSFIGDDEIMDYDENNPKSTAKTKKTTSGKISPAITNTLCFSVSPTKSSKTSLSPKKSIDIPTVRHDIGSFKENTSLFIDKINEENEGKNTLSRGLNQKDLTNNANTNNKLQDDCSKDNEIYKSLDKASFKDCFTQTENMEKIIANFDFNDFFKKDFEEFCKTFSNKTEFQKLMGIHMLLLYLQSKSQA